MSGMLGVWNIVLLLPRFIFEAIFCETSSAKLVALLIGQSKTASSLLVYAWQVVVSKDSNEERMIEPDLLCKYLIWFYGPYHEF